MQLSDGLFFRQSLLFRPLEAVHDSVAGACVLGENPERQVTDQHSKEDDGNAPGEVIPQAEVDVLEGIERQCNVGNRYQRYM